MPDQADIAIIGAGAAGLAAAIFAGEAAPQGTRIVLLDGAKKIGAKILVSGGGRCNVTHHRVTDKDYNGPKPTVRAVLKSFTQAQTVAWFDSLGVQLKHEPTGKLFPTTDSARTVLSALVHRCDQLGVELLTNHRVTAINPPADAVQPFVIRHSHGTLTASRIIMATGGRSLPKSGSDGAGWQIVQTLGHAVTDTYPALAPLVLRDSMFHKALSGLACDVTLSTFAGANNKLIDRRCGSMLFTHFGISGPVVMDASRFWIIAHAQGQQPELRCSFIDEPFEKVDAWLAEQGQSHARRTIASVLSQRLTQRLAEQLCQHMGVTPDTPMGQLRKDARRSLVHGLIGLDLQVYQDRGWNYAEVTAGGVPVEEVDRRTFESRKQPGLYLIGEMLDCEGRIGGFNFQWAWSTAYLAGRAAAQSLCVE